MTKHYGIIGQSPEVPLMVAMHQAALKASKIDADYKYFDIDPVNPEALAIFCYESDLNEIAGFSVTAPYKEQVMDYLDQFDPIAKKMGVADVIENVNSNLNGFNSEATAMVMAWQGEIKAPVGKVLVLGADTLAREMIYSLKEFGAQVYVWDPSRKKLAQLEEEFKIEILEFREIQLNDFQTLINAISMDQTLQTTESLFKSDQMRPGMVVMETSLRPLKTSLLREAEKAGAKTISAERTLLHKAASEFTIWFNEPAPFKVMEEALYHQLKKQDEKIRKS